jgi:hypothetical protein
MPAPEIKARLSADGVQDVVNAFRRVRQEARETKEETSLLGEAMGQMGDLIPLVTIGAAVAKFVELGKAAMESAIDIGKLAEKTGASAGSLSVMAMAAHDVGVSQDEMGGGLVKLAKNQEAASQGSSKSIAAFKLLGVSIQDIKSKNPGDLFVEIAQKMQTVPPGAQRAAVAVQLFGRSGANLIPMINEIGKADGWDEAVEKAKKLGLYMSDDMVASAKAAEESIKNMQDMAKGFATQFITGLMPEMTNAVDNFAKSVSDNGASGFAALGSIAGRILNVIVDEFRGAANEVATYFTSLVGGIASSVEVIKSVVSGAKTMAGSVWNSIGQGPSAMLDALKHSSSYAWNGVKSSASDMTDRQRAIWRAGSANERAINADEGRAISGPALTLPKAKTTTGGGTGGSGDGTDDAEKKKAEEERRKLIDARAAYEDAVDSAELQKQKLRDTQAEDQDKARYDAGLETLTQYYDDRAQRINQAMDAEESVLTKKLTAEEAAAAALLKKSESYVKNLVQQGPKAIEAAAGSNTQALAMLQKVATTRAQIDEDEIKRQTQLQQNESARQAAQKQADAQMLSDREKLYTLQGNTSAAQQVALEKELKDTDDLMKRLGVSEGTRQQILYQAEANATAKNRMSALTTSGGAAFESMGTATADVQDKASAGSISSLAAEAQIYKIEQDRLPMLQKIAQSMQDVVDDNELQLLYLTPGTDAYKAQLEVVSNLQRQTDEYTKKVNKVAASLTTTKTLGVEMSNQLASQGAASFISFFDAIGEGTKSAQDAFADLGKSFEAMIVHMIDQMLVYYALMAVVGWIAPGSNLYKSLSKSGPFSGVTGFSSGGYTGDASTNQVVGVTHGREFVSNAATTAKYRPLLELIQSGSTNSIASSSTYSSFGSSSSATGDSSGDGLVQINITNNSGSSATATQKTANNGQSIIDVVIGQVASNISAGGSVAQSIQSTYGVNRKGTIRG